MVFLTLLLAACSILPKAILTSAFPNTSPPKSCTTQLATFDDINDENPTGPTIPIGTYRTLNFPGLTLGTHDPDSPTGVIPQSGEAYAVFNAETELLTLSSVAAITVENDGSTTKSFSLPSFYYATALASQEELVGLPAAGTIAAKGYDAAGSVVASQSFEYTFTADKQGMALAEPVGFSDLYKVEFSVAGALNVGILDSVSLVTCTS